MTNLESLDELTSFIRAHHVHFDVQSEVTMSGAERISVGYVVRLWAVHDKDAKALPGCVKCMALVAELRRVAALVIPEEVRPTRVEVEPFSPALYDSTEVHGVDEVAIMVRVTHREHYESPIDRCEERCIREIRDRLKRLGIRER